MDDSFLGDFNMSDPPVFARKSAPPPDTEESPSVSRTPAMQTFPSSPCSTPSSSILNSSNDNSRNISMEEPMEQDNQNKAVHDEAIDENVGKENVQHENG